MDLFHKALAIYLVLLSILIIDIIMNSLAEVLRTMVPRVLSINARLRRVEADVADMKAALESLANFQSTPIPQAPQEEPDMSAEINSLNAESF